MPMPLRAQVLTSRGLPARYRRLNVAVDDDTHRRLLDLAERRNTTLAKLARDALERELRIGTLNDALKT